MPKVIAQADGIPEEKFDVLLSWAVNVISCPSRYALYADPFVAIWYPAFSSLFSAFSSFICFSLLIVSVKYTITLELHPVKHYFIILLY